MYENAFLFTMSALYGYDHTPQPGAVRLLKTLLDQRASFVILTDDSLHSREEITERLKSSGFYDLRQEHVYTTCMAAIDYILRNEPEKTTAGYFGSNAIAETLRSAGFSLNLSVADWFVVGRDRNLSLQDMNYALRLVQNGAKLVEIDSRLTIGKKKEPQLGCGSIVRLLQELTGAEVIHADFPQPMIIKQALLYLGRSAEQTLFVSGKLEREIEAGNSAGLRTVLTTAGMKDDDDLMIQKIHPTYVTENLNGLLSD